MWKNGYSKSPRYAELFALAFDTQTFHPTIAIIRARTQFFGQEFRDLAVHYSLAMDRRDRETRRTLSEPHRKG